MAVLHTLFAIVLAAFVGIMSGAMAGIAVESIAPRWSDAASMAGIVGGASAVLYFF